jgi:phage shock protein C
VTEPSDAPAPETPEPEPPRPNELRRRRDNRVVAGVCSGLGAYFGLDPVVFRIAFVVLTFIGGIGLLLYVLAWILIPEADGAGEGRAAVTEGGAIVGFALVVIGGLLLLRAIAPDWFSGRYVWPIVLILLGLAVVYRSAKR